MNRIGYISLGLLISALVQSCGGGGSGNPDNSGRSGTNKSYISVNITDSPVYDASAVWIQVTGLSLKPVEADPINFTFDVPMDINLLSLQGSRSEILIDNQSVPDGEYEWMRLHINAEIDNQYDSYIVINDAMYELEVPSGSQVGLRINNIGELQANKHLSFTIDFDLARSVVQTASDEYKLKPVLRLVRNDHAGYIRGVIDQDVLISNCSDLDPNTGNAIYIFENNTIPDDIDNINPDPITIARVEYNSETNQYEYEAGFLPEGLYTVAFTCWADSDDPDVNDASVVFADVRNNVGVEEYEDESDDSEDHIYR